MRPSYRIATSDLIGYTEILHSLFSTGKRAITLVLKRSAQELEIISCQKGKSSVFFPTTIISKE